MLRLGIFLTDRTASAALEGDALNPEEEIGTSEGRAFSGRVCLNDGLTSEFNGLRVNNNIR